LRIPDVVEIPGGEFEMGSERGRDDERPVHRVGVPAFTVCRTPITNAQYAFFLDDCGVEPPPWWRDAAFADPDQPVVGVTWFDARDYGRWLGRKTGRRWRLPTEAEWERAARGGLEQQATAWGSVVPSGELPEEPPRAPWRVGRGTPNSYGLLDAGTIVHEWCLDWYDPAYYSRSPCRSPTGPRRGDRRSSRGGAWRHRIRWSTPSARSSLPPGFRYSDYGFRLVCRGRVRRSRST